MIIPEIFEKCTNPNSPWLDTTIDIGTGPNSNYWSPHWYMSAAVPVNNGISLPLNYWY